MLVYSDFYTVIVWFIKDKWIDQNWLPLWGEILSYASFESFESFESPWYDSNQYMRQMRFAVKYPYAESECLELKRQPPNKLQIIKTAVGFCNTRGGKIIIGVDDDQNIIGLSQTEIYNILETFDQAIFSACHPHIVPRLYVRTYEDKSIIVMEIFEGMSKPYFIHAEGVDNGTYIRLGRHTRRATSNIIQELKWQSNGVDFEKLPKYEATIEDINIKSVSDFLKNRQNKAEVIIDEQIIKSYSIVTLEQGKIYPSILGLLLFGKDPQQFLSEAMIICSHFRGTSGRDSLATIDCQGTLFNQIKQAMHFIEQRLNKKFTITKLKRFEQLEIPKIAIREALLNMILHRNYYINAPSKIAIYDDRVEFFSPGKFPGPIDKDNIKSGITYLRNPSIAKILREANYIEKLGSGFITIFDSCNALGIKEPEVIEGSSYVKCIIYRELASVSEDHLQLSVEKENAKILSMFSADISFTIQEVADFLAVSRPTAVRKMNRLIASGLIERLGSTRNVRYKKSDLQKV